MLYEGALKCTWFNFEICELTSENADFDVHTSIGMCVCTSSSISLCVGDATCRCARWTFFVITETCYGGVSSLFIPTCNILGK